MMRYVNAVAPPPAKPTIVSAKHLPDNREIKAAASEVSSSGHSTVHIVDEDSTDVTIAVMGATGSGKTTFINLVSGSELRVGRGLQSCTSVVQMAKPFERNGRWVTLIDTPGFDDTTKSDADVLRMIAAFLATAYENGKKLAGVIYFHRISDFRMGGISTRNFKMFRELCGESTLRNVVLVTNMWGEVSKEIGEAREAELAGQDMFFKPVLDKGAQLLRHNNTFASAQRILDYLIGNHPLSLCIQRELVDQGKDISQTAAGAELNRELMKQIEKHRKEMKILQEEMQEAIRTKDEATKKELETETKKLQTEMNRVQSESQKLVSAYSEEKRRLEWRMRELSESARKEAERNAVGYQHQIDELQRQLTQAASTSTREKDEVLQELSRLRARHSQRKEGGIFGQIGKAIDIVFGMR